MVYQKECDEDHLQSWSDDHFEEEFKSVCSPQKVGTYTVAFYNSNGSSSTAFAKLKTTVTKNDYLTLPSVPAKSGYEVLGWSTSKNASRANYAVGKKIRIKKSQRLYAVYKKNATVTLCKNNGAVYKTISGQIRNFL